MDVAALVRTGAEAIGFLNDHLVDVILLDIGLPDEDGLLTGKRIFERWPGAKIVALSILEDDRAQYEAFRIGFQAFLMKDTPPDDFVRMVGSVARGEAVPPLRASPKKLPDELTRREQEVLDLLVEGADGRTVAARLEMTKGEVRTAIQGIMEKLQVDSRLGAMIKALEGIPDPSKAHPHPTLMSHDQLLEHLRYMHARGIAPINPSDFDNLRKLHRKLHREPPPSLA
jgi:DNA-binding NarL/FixJ family response regulator